MKLALIDLGSNSARMSLTERTEDGKMKEYARRRRMVRLSEGMDASGCLQEEPMTRAMEALEVFAEEIRNEGAETLAVATAAVRRAENGAEFCRRVQNRCGISIQVIDGETEAYLDFCGVLASLPSETGGVVMDTGGGSTELIVVQDRAMAGRISLPIGAMTLTDRYFRGESFAAATEQAKAMIQDAFATLPFAAEAQGLPIIGLGGSAVALAVMDAVRCCEECKNPHGYRLDAVRVREWYQRLGQMTPSEKMERFGLEQGRADTICAGILPTLVWMETFGAPHLTICTAGLREGILARIEETACFAGFDQPSRLLRRLVDDEAERAHSLRN